jgi:hypothetical protein
MPELLLFPVELRRFFEEPRNAVILPVAIIVPFLSLWPYFSSPLIPALAATIACMEPYYLNMWYLWPGQFEGFALRPIRWRMVIAVKNLVAFVLTLMLFWAFAAITFYFHNGRIAPLALFGATLPCIIAGIVLAVFGNNYSVVSPRARIGWTLTDLAASILALLVGGISLIPVIVLSYLIGPWEAYGVLIILAALLWAGWSLPNTSARIAESIPELWMNAAQS